MTVSILADYEAKARSRLEGFRNARCRWTNHGLNDVGHQDGIDYLVMEYLFRLCEDP